MSFSATGWRPRHRTKVYLTGSNLIISLLLLLTSCQGDDRTPRPITGKRTIAAPVHRVIPGASHDQRFQNFRPPRVPVRPVPQLGWDTPRGWVDLGPTTTRQANFRPANNPASECYLAILPGGGGLEDNVNRWRRQMGKRPLSSEEVLALPERPLLGAPARWIEITGDFSGLSGGTLPDARLFGLILTFGDSGLFVKMTGPDALLVAERERFLGFCDSLHLQSIPPPRESPGGALPDLTWTAPKGWIVDPPKPMRHFTYHAGTNTECYLSILGGSAGGLERNVNRWRREIGLDPLSAQEIAKLDSAPMLGGNATLIEGSGTFQGVSGPPRDGFRLLGLILPSPGRTFFLKMVGPAAEVETLRDGFLFLAQSIEIKN